MWFIRFKQALTGFLLPWLIALIIQSSGRAYLLIRYSNQALLSGYQQDVIKLFTTGLIFDIRVTTIIYGVLLILSGLLAIHRRLFTRWQNLFPLISTIVTLIITWMTVSNIFYFATYDRYIDVFIFGLIDDDTKAILITLWHDYPVISGIVVIALFILFLHYIYRLWFGKVNTINFKHNHYLTATTATFCCLALVFLGVRGSVSTFPLRQSDTQISEIRLLNMLTPNGIIALSWAYKDYKNNNHFPEATNEQGEQLLTQFYQKPLPASLDVFIAKTKYNDFVKQHPPHIVVAVMESLGEHLLTLDNPQRDLLGSLREHWQDDWRFHRFVSEGDGTIDSLNRFFVRSPMSMISQSTAQFSQFKSNMFIPFLTNGYKVIYLTPGNGSWRNLNQFLPHLGVTEFVEQSTLKRLYPEAEEGPWGVADEYMFRYAEHRLQQADKAGEHLLIMMMSTTFHPPYQAPDHKDYQFSLTAKEQQRLSNFAQGKELNEVFNTLRYSNDRLGNFISDIKHSPLSNNTIIAVTGDHNVRGIGYPAPQEAVLGHAVPFYLYIPEQYKIDVHFDANRVGSHKDIFPTLYELSLSDTDYYQTGVNLLAKQLNPVWYGGYNPNVFLSNEGAYTYTDRVEFRPWSNDPNSLLLGDSSSLTEQQQQQYKHWQTFTELLNWQINRQVHAKK